MAEPENNPTPPPTEEKPFYQPVADWVESWRGYESGPLSKTAQKIQETTKDDLKIKASTVEKYAGPVIATVAGLGLLIFNPVVTTVLGAPIKLLGKALSFIPGFTTLATIASETIGVVAAVVLTPIAWMAFQVNKPEASEKAPDKADENKPLNNVAAAGALLNKAANVAIGESKVEKLSEKTRAARDNAKPGDTPVSENKFNEFKKTVGEENCKKMFGEDGNGGVKRPTNKVFETAKNEFSARHGEAARKYNSGWRWRSLRGSLPSFLQRAPDYVNPNPFKTRPGADRFVEETRANISETMRDARLAAESGTPPAKAGGWLRSAVGTVGKTFNRGVGAVAVVTSGYEVASVGGETYDKHKREALIARREKHDSRSVKEIEANALWDARKATWMETAKIVANVGTLGLLGNAPGDFGADLVTGKIGSKVGEAVHDLWNDDGEAAWSDLKDGFSSLGGVKNSVVITAGQNLINGDPNAILSDPSTWIKKGFLKSQANQGALVIRNAVEHPLETVEYAAKNTCDYVTGANEPQPLKANPAIKAQDEKEKKKKLAPQWNDGNYPNLAIAIAKMKLFKEVPRPDSPGNTDVIKLDSNEITELMKTGGGRARIQANLKSTLADLVGRKKTDSSWDAWQGWAFGTYSSVKDINFKSDLVITRSAITDLNRFYDDYEKIVREEAVDSTPPTLFNVTSSAEGSPVAPLPTSSPAKSGPQTKAPSPPDH